jgi:uncharacterized membrane protein
MPGFEFVAFLALSLLGPVVVSLIVLASVRHAKKRAALVYSVGLLVLLAAVVASIGFHVYAVPLHPSWWGPMIWADIVAGVLTVFFAAGATAVVLPELVD